MHNTSSYTFNISEVQMNDALLRQWVMLRHIPRHPRKIDTVTLQEKLDKASYVIDLRTIQRDLNKLSSIFPLIADGAKPQGWSWRSDAPPIDVPSIDPQTALVFKMAEQYLKPLLPSTTLEYLDPWLKSADGILNQSKDVIANWNNKVAVIPRGFSLQPPATPADIQNCIYNGLLQQKQISVTYQSSKTDNPKEYIIHPLGLVVREQVSYIVCMINDHLEPRHLVLHRIKQAILLEQTSKECSGFSLSEYIESGQIGWIYKFKQINAVLRMSKRASLPFYETPQDIVLQKFDLENDIVRIRVILPDTKEMRAWLLGFGDELQVLQPQSLRKELADIAYHLHTTYQKSVEEIELNDKKTINDFYE